MDYRKPQQTGTGGERWKVSGSVRIEVIDGPLAGLVREGHNIIVDGGMAWLTGALTGDVAAPATLKYIGIGTGSTAADHADAALEAEVETRATGAQSRSQDIGAGSVTYTVVGTITMTAPRALREVGLLSASPGGTLAARQVYDVINLVAGNSIQVTWAITITRA